jgi:hypothetical protein
MVNKGNLDLISTNISKKGLGLGSILSICEYKHFRYERDPRSLHVASFSSSDIMVRVALGCPARAAVIVGGLHAAGSGTIDWLRQRRRKRNGGCRCTAATAAGLSAAIA